MRPTTVPENSRSIGEAASSGAGIPADMAVDAAPAVGPVGMAVAAAAGAVAAWGEPQAALSASMRSARGITIFMSDLLSLLPAQGPVSTTSAEPLRLRDS